MDLLGPESITQKTLVKRTKFQLTAQVLLLLPTFFFLILSVSLIKLFLISIKKQLQGTWVVQSVFDS